MGGETAGKYETLINDNKYMSHKDDSHNTEMHRNTGMHESHGVSLKSREIEV